MCRLAVLFRRPLHEVAAWPANEVRLIEHYLAKQPAPEERIEIAVASLCAMFKNVHQREGAEPVNTETFLPYLHPWRVATAGRYSDVDRSIMAAFGMKLA